MFMVKTSSIHSIQICLKDLPLVPSWHIVFLKLMFSKNMQFYACIMTILCDKLENKTGCFGRKICAIKALLKQKQDLKHAVCSCTNQNSPSTYMKWEFMTLFMNFTIHYHLLSSSSNGATARGRPRPPSRVSSILSGFGRLLSNFYILALLHLPSLCLPTTTWVYLLGAFLLTH